MSCPDKSRLRPPLTEDEATMSTPAVRPGLCCWPGLVSSSEILSDSAHPGFLLSAESCRLQHPRRKKGHFSPRVSHTSGFGDTGTSSRLLQTVSRKSC